MCTTAYQKAMGELVGDALADGLEGGHEGNEDPVADADEEAPDNAEDRQNEQRQRQRQEYDGKNLENQPDSFRPGIQIKYLDRKSTRLNSSHSGESRMPSSA